MNLEHNIKNLKQSLINDEENALKLQRSINAIHKKEIEIKSSYENFLKNIPEIKQKEATMGMQNMWGYLYKSIQDSNNSRDKLIIPSLNMMVSDIKDKKKLSEQLEKDLQTKHKAELKYNDPKLNEENKKKQQANYEKAHSEFETKQLKFENGISTYLKNRNEEYKALILQLISTEMQMHVSEIQNLTNLASEVEKINEGTESDLLIEKLMGKNLLKSNNP